MFLETRNWGSSPGRRRLLFTAKIANQARSLGLLIFKELTATTIQIGKIIKIGFRSFRMRESVWE